MAAGATVDIGFSVDLGSYGQFDIDVHVDYKIGEIIDDSYDTISAFWRTINEDIVGSNLFGDIQHDIEQFMKNQMPTPDIKVDIKDVAKAASGFGSYPGHDRWQTVADINGDYQINIKDVAAIAKMFGWVG